MLHDETIGVEGYTIVVLRKKLKEIIEIYEKITRGNNGKFDKETVSTLQDLHNKIECLESDIGILKQYKL